MTQKFQVATGIVMFRGVEAHSPYDALRTVKAMIDSRRYVYNPNIGMSLVEALDAGSLNFLVFDEHRRDLLAGEHRGNYREPVTVELGQAMRYHLTVGEIARLHS